MSSASQPHDLLQELRWRGLLHQTTGEEELRAHLLQPGRVGYCGFDPTRDSLTIGNFIAIKLLMHWQRAGHQPVVLMGGGTGLIGDPSGKDAERQLLSREEVEHNIAGQRAIMERLLQFDGPCAARLVNNIDWLAPLGYIEVLRDVGKHFSVNAMIQKDSVRERLQNREQGISYTEFSYMILQAYDFLHLRRTLGCTVQIAGSDQYGNIVAGVDLIRRAMAEQPAAAPRAWGLTAPLLTKSDGKKIGKTETGAVWLSAARTSPYRMYQYWLNADDRDVEAFLKWFTFLPAEEIAALHAEHCGAPHLRLAQRRLAQEFTGLLHGAAEVRRAEQASEALFGGEVRDLDADLLAEVCADVPCSDHPLGALAGEGVSLAQLLAETTLAGSRREARQLLGTGAVMVNGARLDKADAAERRLTPADLLHGDTILLKRGKRRWHATRWR